MERKSYPSEMQERFIVRLPDGMRDRIAEAAKAANRSMNAEIVARLQSTFADSQSEISLSLSAETLSRVRDMAAASKRTVEQELQALLQPAVTQDEFDALKLLAEMRKDQQLILQLVGGDGLGKQVKSTPKPKGSK